MLNRMRKTLSRRALDAYKARKQRKANLSLDHALGVVRAMLRQTKYCFLITNSSGQWPSARLVQPIVDEADEFVLYFGTDPELRKAREIEADPHVTIALENERENANLVLYGKASLERNLDTCRRRWIGSWRLFFPGGPQEEGYVVIRFAAERIELMNFTRDVIAEPFGLRPVALARDADGTWALTDYTNPAVEPTAAG